MNKLFSIIAAGAVVAAAAVSTVTPSFADPAGDAAAGAIIGGTLGFMAGAAAANGGGPIYMHHRRFRDWEWRQHVADCQDEYGWRYDPRTDIVRMHGDRFYCDL